jgi:hypothetical protein
VSEAFTDDELLDGISRAIAARDFPSVVPLLRMLALQAPGKAQQIYDAVVNRKITIEVPL